MKANIQNIFLFCSPILLIWAGLYFHFETKIKQDVYTIFQSDKSFETAPKNFDYLIGGHSRLNRAIDTELLPHSVKATTHGESFIETYYKLKYILSHTDKKFKTLILPFESGTFKPNDFRRSIYWIKYVNFFEVGFRKGELGKYISVYLQAKFFPFLPYYKKKIMGLFYHKKTGLEIDKTNGRFSDLSKEKQQQFIQEDVDYLNKVGIIDPTTKHYVHKIISLTQEHDIQLIYIKTPLTQNYTKALSGLDKSGILTHKKLEKFVQQFDHVTVINMESVFFDRDSLFSDHHHLNVEGRRVFTNLLLKKLNQQN